MARKTTTKQVESTGAEVVSTATKAKKTYKAKRKLDPNQLVTVVNGFHGILVYQSSRTGEVFTWERFGDEQEIELYELKNAKNSHRAFFEGGYFLINDPEVIEYLGVGSYYNDVLNFEEFDSIFEMKPEELEERLSRVPRAQKASIAYRAKAFIDEGKIDSIKVINTLEKFLGVELIER